MTASYVTAAIQMNSGEDVAENLAQATRLIEQSAASDSQSGAQFIVLPELFNCLGRFEAIVAAAEPIPGPTSDTLCALAKKLGVMLVAGSIAEQAEQADKAYNTSLVIAPDGALLAKYRKIHLFDVAIDDGPRTTESDWILPGNEVSSVASDFGVLGQTICYDLRFAELYRALATRGAEIILVPAAFTHATGQAHWHALLRARAIENQAYVIAPNQCGTNTMDIDTYGHTLIVDPWGKILAEATTNEEEIVTAEIDLARVAQVRRQIPALAHRRDWLNLRGE